ncbi:MAG: energy transducer TonB [Acidobacteriota bacterium]
MFEIISRNSALSQRACIRPLLTSIAVHAVVAGMIVIAPLLIFRQIPENDALTFLFKIPDKLIPIFPNPPPVQSKIASTGQSEESSAGYRINISTTDMTEPKNIPKIIPVPSGELPLFRAGDALSALGDGSGSVRVGGETGAGWSTLLTAEVLPPLEMPQPPVQKKILRTGALNPAKLILRVPPKYPELASRVGISGVVKLEAIIDEEGNVTNITVLEGHVLLQNAAVEAVRQWKYSPTIQNGEPIPIRGLIRIIFSLQR